MNKKLVLGYSPYGHPGSVAPFNEVFDKAISLSNIGVRDCDAILLWGGTDIDPSYYKEERHPLTQAAHSSRDTFEWECMRQAAEAGVPIIGVCRGAQFLCAFAGGKLVQHMTGHHGDHGVVILDRETTKVYQTSSDHHQCLDLSKLPEDIYKLLAESVGDKVPEVVLFPKIRGLAIQGHPEWMETYDPFVQWVLEQVEALLETENEERLCL